MTSLRDDDPGLDQLLTTKLYIPRPHPNLVSRPRLVTRLDEALTRTLTVISAPAGFGKTTLLSSWLDNLRFTNDDLRLDAAKENQIVNPKPVLSEVEASKIVNQVAWLSLDEADNDPVRFLSYLIAALHTIQAGVGETTLAALQAQHPQPPSIESILTRLINDIASIPHEFVLVLDDYHLIETAAIHEALTFLLDHGPPRLHLVIASRTEPPLPLARLRARRQLLELRTADLRFRPEEAATFLNQMMGLDLSAEEVAALEARTEGWIAGLQLAALSMQDRQDIADFIATFTGSHRYVIDYLAEEVLQQQPEPIREFLLQTSILDRLSGPLCEAVIQFTSDDLRFTIGSAAEGSKSLSANRKSKTRPEHSRRIVSGQLLLELLEQLNLFIIPLDDERRWYRYHHLFAECLRDHLRRQVGPQELALLHRRAAAWYEQNGLPAEAMRHALTVADVERASRLVEQSGRSLLRRSELTTLLNWLEALPQERVRARPQLSLFQAWALVLTGELDAVEAQLAEISPGDAEVVPPDYRAATAADRSAEIWGEMMAIRATVAYLRQDLPQAIKLYRQALARLPEENLFLRGAVAMTLATACNVTGDMAGAMRVFEQASTIYQADGNATMGIVADWNLAQLHRRQARLRQAAERQRQTLQRTGPRTEPLIGRVHVGLAEILYQWNDLKQAVRHLQQGIELGQQSQDAATLVGGYLALAQAKQAQGDWDGAVEALHQAEAFMQKNELPGWQVRLAAGQTRLGLARGDLTAAGRWAQKTRLQQIGDRLDDSAGYVAELRWLERLTCLRLDLAQASSGAKEKIQPVLDSLTALHQAAERTAQTEHRLEVLALQALAYQAGDDTAAALAALEQALSLAEPEGYIRLFIDEGQPLADLLRRAASQNILPDYASQLLAAFEADSSVVAGQSTLIEPLSERELEVLNLIAEGLSNRQIAAELVLTVGTVKWHINNLYGKLGVSRRTQAVAEARELNLL